MAAYAAPVTMALDKDEVLSCPFNKNHKVHACRFPYHIVKCRKNYPMLARKMATCPFNACHIMPRCELQHHISRCPERSYVERELSHAMKLSNGGVPKVLPTPPCHSVQMECTEDWDVEIESWTRNSREFTWGVGYKQRKSGEVNFSNIPANMSPAMKTLFKKQLGDAMETDYRSEVHERVFTPGEHPHKQAGMVNIRIPSTLPDVLSEWMEDCAVGGHPSTGQRKKLISLAPKFEHLSDTNKLQNTTSVDARSSISSHADPRVGDRVGAGGMKPPLQIAPFTPTNVEQQGGCLKP